MLKRYFAVVIVVLLALPVAEARKKRAKTGKVDGSTYQDAGYGFQITFPDNWKPKSHKPDGFVRLTLVQKDFDPSKLRGRPLNKIAVMPSVPLIELWILETAASPDQVLDSLLSEKSKSAWKKPLFTALQPSYTDATFRGIKGRPYAKTKAGSHKGMLWRGTFEYEDLDAQLEMPLGVSLVCLSIDDKTSLVILVRAEPEYLDASMDVAFGMLKSLRLQSAERE